MTIANPFSDLIPTTTATTGARPVPSDFRGHLQDYMTAARAYRTAHPATGTPVATPGGGTTGAPLPGTPAGGTTSTPAHPATGGTTNALSPQQTALNNFANSAGMQFQLKQGSDAIQNLYAAHGALQSGAAMKALQGYAQGTALNNYFLPYMNLLGGQQAVGAGAASSVAGVGSSFGNTAAGINQNLGNAATGINASMGGALQNGADATGNAALLRGQSNANMWQGIGSAIGSIGSSFVPRPSY